MSDYGNSGYDPLDPSDPYRRDARIDPDRRASNVVTGWVVAAVFLVAILAIVFGVSHQMGPAGTNTASNDVAARPAATHMTPPPSQPQTNSGLQAAPKPPLSPTSPTPAPATRDQ
jgi:hypothetical protein